MKFFEWYFGFNFDIIEDRWWGAIIAILLLFVVVSAVFAVCATLRLYSM